MISVTSCISCDPFLVLSCILDVYLCGLSLKDLKTGNGTQLNQVNTNESTA